LLGAERVRLEYPTQVVFDSLTLGLADGDRTGIVGRNGDGKSSLLGLLARTITPDSGQVTWRTGLRVGFLTQGDSFPDGVTVGEAVVGGKPDHEWARDARVRDIVNALVADLDFARPLGELSGGQRRRVDLAALLAGEWDVLLLDEPTNHLDIAAIGWLARHLKSRWPAGRGALALVTHDRWFLDEVATATWEVHDRIVEPFEGGYAAYVLQRVERDRQAAAAQAKRQNLLRKELAWLRRGPPARTSKPKFRIDAANALIADVPELRDKVSLVQLATARLGKTVVDLVGVTAGYGGPPVLADITWRIGPGERSGLIGANGAGKSTLLSLIAGDGQAVVTAGRIKRGQTVRVGLLDQRGALLDESEDEMVRTVLGRLKTVFQVGKAELSASQLLERLGFDRAQFSTPVRDLSGGERRRLQLLMVLAAEPNVLILDEPTNDVDTDMLAALEDFLDSWPGTLIVVTHDRYLVERATDQQYALIDGHLRHLPGGVDEYLRLAAAAATPPTAPANPPAGASKAAAERAQRKALAAVERKIAKAEAAVAEAQAALAAHDPADYQGLARLMADLEARQQELGELETEWLTLA
jgi:ATPase subunit of ABC transporter with duplicated ATPase domains